MINYCYMKGVCDEIIIFYYEEIIIQKILYCHWCYFLRMWISWLINSSNIWYMYPGKLPLIFSALTSPMISIQVSWCSIFYTYDIDRLHLIINWLLIKLFPSSHTSKQKIDIPENTSLINLDLKSKLFASMLLVQRKLHLIPTKSRLTLVEEKKIIIEKFFIKDN